MFAGASGFNQPLNNWNTSKVEYMNGVFNEATSFNQPLNNWDTSKVKSFGWMFQDATSFNQDLSTWVMTGATTVSDMLTNTALSTYNYNELLDKRSQQAVKT